MEKWWQRTSKYHFGVHYCTEPHCFQFGTHIPPHFQHPIRSMLLALLQLECGDTTVQCSAVPVQDFLHLQAIMSALLLESTGFKYMF
jgi:hypothetical protein